MDLEQLRESDRKKYGPKGDDLIARAYRDNKNQGDVWCIGNIRRYLDRFIRVGSTKAENLTDLIKAREYLNRMIEENEKTNETKKEEVIE